MSFIAWAEFHRFGWCFHVEKRESNRSFRFATWLDCAIKLSQIRLQSFRNCFQFITCTLNMASVNEDNAASGSSPPSEARVAGSVLAGLLRATTETNQDEGSPSDRHLAAATHSTAVTPAGGSSRPSSRAPTQDHSHDGSRAGVSTGGSSRTQTQASSRDGSNDRSSARASGQIQNPPGVVRLLAAANEDTDVEDSEDDRKPEALEVKSTSSEEGYLYDDTYSSKYVIEHKIGVSKPITGKVERSLRVKRRVEKIVELENEPPKKKVKGAKKEYVPRTFEEAMKELANKKSALKRKCTELKEKKLSLELSDRVSHFQVKIATDAEARGAHPDMGMQIYRLMRETDLTDDSGQLDYGRVLLVKQLLEDISRKYVDEAAGMDIDTMEAVYQAKFTTIERP